MRMLLRALLSLAVALLGLSAVPAFAHLTPNSEIRLHFEPGSVRGEVLIPAGEYAFATGFPADNRAASLRTARAYLLDHAAARSPDGRVWRKSVERIAVVEAPGGPDLVASLRFESPEGASDRVVTLRWDAVIEASPDHFALLAVDSDLAAGVAEDHDLLGAFAASRPAITVDRGEAGRGGLVGGALRLGMHHILSGHDHLLFLLALLLPAPLLAAGSRWNGPREPSSSIRSLALIVSAFTVGHSLTLIAAAVFDAQLPPAPVEALIALSVLISAVHALRPLFAGREPLVALLFGLVHGLAFATVVGGFGATAGTRAAAILGFNLGIELVQLGLVALLLPALLLGARTRWYRPARLALGTLTALAAAAWLAERLTGRANPVAAGFEAALPPLGLALVAASLALGLVWWVRRPRPALPVAAPLRQG